MKFLSPAEIEALLETHGPQALLTMYEDRLDAQGLQMLENAKAEEASAASRLQEMSAAFRDGLPPVPDRPWLEEQPPAGGQRPRWNRFLWSAMAAIILLPALLFWYFSPFRNMAIRQTRHVLSPAELEQAQQQLSAAWIQFAQNLIQNGAETPAQDQKQLRRLAGFYLDATSHFDPTDPAQQVVIDALRQANDLAPAAHPEPWRFDEPPPAAFLEMARSLHKAVSGQDDETWKNQRSLTPAYLSIADHFTNKALMEKLRGQATIANQWAAFFLELAILIEPDRSDSLIRLIRVKELLGEDEEANALAERLNKILTRD